MLLADPDYTEFTPSLEKAIAKTEEYNDRLGVQEAYVIAMGQCSPHRDSASQAKLRLPLALEPTNKLRYIKKNWGKADYELSVECLQRAVRVISTQTFHLLITCVKFRKAYNLVNQPSTKPTGSEARTAKKPKGRLVLSDSEDKDAAKVEPWEKEYNKYMKVNQVVGDDESVIEWWGIRSFVVILVLYSLLISRTYLRGTISLIRSGLRLPVTTCQSWHLPYRVNAHFHRLALQ